MHKKRAAARCDCTSAAAFCFWGAYKKICANQLFIFIKSVPCKGDTTRGKRKLKQGQKTAFPFPLMVSPLHTSSLNPYSLPFFIPPHFACRRRPNPFHLFVPFSIAMFTSFSFTPFLYLPLFGKLESEFIRVSFTLCYRFLQVISSICCSFCLALPSVDFLNPLPLYLSVLTF